MTALPRLKIRVAVPTAETAPYDVVIGGGILTDAGPLIAAAAPATAYAVIAPAEIARLYGTSLMESLRGVAERVELFSIEDGERGKTLSAWQSITESMLSRRFGRDSCVIALGGGVTGDLAGFVAATYMRGVPVIQVPTTLLAMIDASVGGKTGVDTGMGKNLVGSFHPPNLVIIDPRVLATLPPVELQSGMAEAVKHGAVLDAEYFEWLSAHAAALLALEPVAVERLIARSVELKAAIVAEDPFERGRRALLNFGHTVGHAIELRRNYTVPHGFAVAEGMLAEAAIGECEGVTEAGTASRIAELLGAVGLPARCDHFGDLIDSMRLDKKARRGQPRYVLLSRVGHAAQAADGGWTHDVSAAVVQQASDAMRSV